LLAAAQGKPAPSSTHSAEYRLQFVSATDGHVLGEQSLALSEAPRLERVGDLLCVLAGHELVVLGSGAEQKWKATLPATPRHLAGGGGLVIVATEQGVAAFDATTGQSKWNRTGLNAENVAVGPDSGVYVTIELSKDQAGQGEPAKFRKADIQRGGMGAPLPPFTALVKLDPRTGKTRWGVRNIGRRLYFEGDKVFVVDPLEQTNFLANQIMVGGHSVRCLSARSGKEFWSYVKTGDLHHSEVAGSRVFLVTADDAPGGRIRTSCNYQLQLIEGK
jgi:outer membrane protein assembly factor BamB